MMRIVRVFGRGWTMWVAVLVMAVLSWSAGASARVRQSPPKVGDKAIDFTLRSLDGATVRLSNEVASGPLVLVVLRGWPGYQCPFCTKQFGDYRTHAAKFEGRRVRVLFVYPGPSDGLKGHAEAFTSSGTIPTGFRLLLDPDYTFTELYGLRWNAANETAYPSTFIIGKDGIVTFAQTSRSHGDRVTAETVLNALASKEN